MICDDGLLQIADRRLEQRVADPLLFQAHRRTVGVLDEVTIKRRLVRGEMLQVHVDRGRLVIPASVMGEERRTVHQQRPYVGKTRSQQVEDAEAMGVDIAPVVQRHIPQPRRPATRDTAYPPPKIRSDRATRGNARQVSSFSTRNTRTAKSRASRSTGSIARSTSSDRMAR